METKLVFNPSQTMVYNATVLTTKDGLVFVEHPVYGDEAPIQIVQPDNTLKDSAAWDVDSVHAGDY